jgi:hypothetical protein
VDNGLFGIEKNNIDGEAHPNGMNTLARPNPQSFTRFQLTSSQKANQAAEESVSNVEVTGQNLISGDIDCPHTACFSTSLHLKGDDMNSETKRLTDYQDRYPGTHPNRLLNEPSQSISIPEGNHDFEALRLMTMTNKSRKTMKRMSFTIPAGVIRHLLSGKYYYDESAETY